ncbi:MAG: TraB/GumN family protein [Acutalibacteraceae bacterium]
MGKGKYMCRMAAFLAVLFSFSACTAGNGDNRESVPVSAEESQVSKVESSVPSENSNTSETGGITPALWKVTDKDGNSMYCFGSIHATEGEIEWPSYFETAYSECDSLAFEYDITSSLDLENAINSMQSYMYMDGTTIKDHIPEKDYEQAVRILTENKMYVSTYDYFNVVFWFSLMENVCIAQSGLNVMQGVDMQLINRAKADGKTVLEVESEKEQVDMFNNFSDKLQVYLLESYLGEGKIEEQTAAIKETYEKWKKGEDLTESATEEMTEEEKALSDEYTNALIIQRNIKMADTAERYMQSGDTVMMVVGAAHYYGESGILSLLRSKGCTVERVTG